jgi:hypothetical protein
MAGIAAPGGAQAAGGAASARAASSTTLQAVVTPEAVAQSGALSEAAAQGVLLPTLPEGHQTPQELFDTVHSPQFAQVRARRALLCSLNAEYATCYTSSSCACHLTLLLLLLLAMFKNK